MDNLKSTERKRAREIEKLKKEIEDLQKDVDNPPQIEDIDAINAELVCGTVLILECFH